MAEVDVARTLFCKWDLDKADGISQPGLAKLLTQMTSISEEEINVLFKHVDTNADGSIDYDEFSNWLFSCRIPLDSEFVHTSCCPDGHTFGIFRPEVDGWCCEECGEDLAVGRDVLQCSECCGQCWCVKCIMQKAGEQVIEGMALFAVRDTVASNMPVIAKESVPDGCDVQKNGQIQLTICGLSGFLCAIEAHGAWTVRQLKAAVEARTNISEHAQSLIFSCMALQDDDALANFCMPNWAEVTLLQRTEQQTYWLTKLRKSRRPGEQVAPCLADAPQEVRQDKVIVREAVSRCGLDLQNASEDLRADRDIALAALKQDTRSTAYISPCLHADREIALELVKLDGLFLANLNETLQGDPEIVTAAVSRNGFALTYAADDLLYVSSIVDIAVNRGFRLSRTQAHRRAFHECWPIVVSVASADRAEIRYAPKSMLSNRWVAIELLRREPWHLRNIAEELLADQEVVTVAFDHGLSLRDIPVELREHPEVVFAAVQKNGLELKYAAQKLCANRRIVSAAVHKNRRALQYAHHKLQSELKGKLHS